MSDSSQVYDDNLFEGEKKKNWISSGIVHLLIILLLLLPLFKFPIPPPGQQGILVIFGEPDAGTGDEPAIRQPEESSSPQSAPQKTEEIPEEPKPSSPAASKPVQQNQKITTTEVDPAIQLEIARKQKEQEEERKRQEALEEQRREEEARRKAAEEEAKRKAEEEARRQEEFDQKKQQFGTALGEGKGTNDQSGNEGDPAGKPNADVLKGLTTGSGRVGGGLAGRGVLYEPDIKENSQKTGRVVIEVCVDRSGKVSSSRFTQRGSTTTDSQLVKVAVESVRKYIFTQSEIEEQCGIVTIDFKLK